MKEYTKQDQEMLHIIGKPVLPKAAAEIYLALAGHPQAQRIASLQVEKRLVIDMAAFCKESARDYLRRHPEVGLSCEELANLCECHLRTVGLIKRWVDSSAFGGPMEPLGVADEREAGLYRIFMVENFVTEEVGRMGREHITEREIRQGLDELRTLNGAGMLDASSRPQIAEAIAKKLEIPAGRASTILTKLIERGRLMNEGGARIARWRFVEETAQEKEGPLDVLSLRERLDRRKKDIENEIASTNERLRELEIELEKCSTADAVIQSLLD